MNLLVIGSGAREHALAWKLAQSPRVSKVFVAPGNAGTAREAGVHNIALTENSALLEFALQEAIAFTVVGPEAPLAAGVVDIFRTAGQKIFGPTQAAARLESSKSFAKAFMQRHNIPTAAYQSFNDAIAAHRYIEQHGVPIVIKADGLAAGKGVVVATSPAEAHAAIDAMLVDRQFGGAGASLVIEDFLAGEEASFIVMVDGEHVLPLASSQDHKRLYDDDRGPNTGGMGAYSPAPIVTPAVHARIIREIILPTVQGMALEGNPFTGFLYAGLMIDQDANPKVVEFNCRLGDPETEPIMLRLKTDLAELIEHGIAGTLDRVDAEWDRRAALATVLAAHGYPEAPRKGDVINGLPTATDDCHVFHAGTAESNGAIVTQGGRVLCVTALGDSVRQAQRRAYQAVENIHFEGMHYRKDIGHRAIKAHQTY